MSCTGAGTAFKTAACWNDWMVSALRNHVHYVVNYVFEGHRQGADQAQTRGERWSGDACG